MFWGLFGMLDGRESGKIPAAVPCMTKFRDLSHAFMHREGPQLLAG